MSHVTQVLFLRQQQAVLLSLLRELGRYEKESYALTVMTLRAQAPAKES